MARDEEEYKQWQDAYDEVEGEWDEDWSNEEKQQYYENLQVYNEEELKGREEAREDWGDDGDDGHDARIEKLKDRKQLLNHSIANARGEYDYQTQGMRDSDDGLRREEEEEVNSSESGSDMEIERESGSDSGSGSGSGSVSGSAPDAHSDSNPESVSDSGSESDSDMELLSNSE